MGKIEIFLESHTPKIIKERLPVKVRTLTEFIDLIEKEEATNVITELRGKDSPTFSPNPYGLFATRKIKLNVRFKSKTLRADQLFLITFITKSIPWAHNFFLMELVIKKELL